MRAHDTDQAGEIHDSFNRQVGDVYGHLDYNGGHLCCGRESVRFSRAGHGAVLDSTVFTCEARRSAKPSHLEFDKLALGKDRDSLDDDRRGDSSHDLSLCQSPDATEEDFDKLP